MNDPRLAPAAYDNHMVSAIKDTRDHAMAHLNFRREVVMRALGEIPQAGDRKDDLVMLDKAYERRKRKIEEHFIEGMEGLLS